MQAIGISSMQFAKASLDWAQNTPLRAREKRPMHVMGSLTAQCPRLQPAKEKLDAAQGFIGGHPPDTGHVDSKMEA